MQIFLDSANLEDIKKYADWGIVDGVTTNPSLVAKEGVDFETRVKEICAVVPGPVSAEVISTEADEMVKEANVITKWARNVFIKLPMTPDGLKACKALSSEGINVNMTLVFTPAQAMLAAKAGAAFVSPFVGRLDDIGETGMDIIYDIVQIFETYDMETKVLAASLRHPQHVLESMRAGAHIVTIPPKILDTLAAHPLTEKGLANFLADWEKQKK